MRTRWRTLLAVAGVAFVLAGCSANESGTSTSADSAGIGPAPAVPQQPQQGTAGNGKAEQDKGQPVPAPQAGAADRKLSRSARLELTATKVTDVVAEARGIAQGAGGTPGRRAPATGWRRSASPCPPRSWTACSTSFRTWAPAW